MISWLGSQSDQELVLRSIESVIGASQATQQPLFGRNPRLDSSVLSLTRASKQLGLSRSRFRSAIAKALPGASIVRATTPAGRIFGALSPESAERVKDYLDDRVSLKCAARILGFSRDRVQEICVMGRLAMASDSLSRLDCESFASALLARATVTRERLHAERLGEVLRLHVPLMLTDEFLRAVLDGALVVYRSKSEVTVPGHLRIVRDNVMKWIAAQRTAIVDRLTIREAATCLGIKSEVAYQLTRSGLLSCVRGKVGRRPSMVVTRAAMAAFVLRYVLLVDLARAAGVGKKQALHWAQGMNFEVVSGPTIDGGRQYVVERSPGMVPSRWQLGSLDSAHGVVARGHGQTDDA